VKVLNRGVRSFLRFHLDESETARTPSVAIRHDAGRFNGANLGKNLF
jgi:hypothetical protein